jgi:hypothetical protein
MADHRRTDYRFKKLHGAKVKRPKTLRCLWCKEKIAVKPQGRLPAYCSHSCRQRAYERAKWQPPHLLALSKDLKRVAIQAEIRKAVEEVPRQMVSVGAAAPPRSHEAPVRRCGLSRLRTPKKRRLPKLPKKRLSRPASALAPATRGHLGLPRRAGPRSGRAMADICRDRARVGGSFGLVISSHSVVTRCILGQQSHSIVRALSTEELTFAVYLRAAGRGREVRTGRAVLALIGDAEHDEPRVIGVDQLTGRVDEAAIRADR